MTPERIRELQISEARFRRLFEAARDGIIILGTGDFRIQEINPFLEELLGVKRQAMVGKTLHEAGLFADLAEEKRLVNAMLESGFIRADDMPLIDHRGQEHAVEVIANVYDEDGSEVVQINIRDIKERLNCDRAREALLASEQQARREAEAASISKDAFLATLSHEIRTPLNAISGWASLLSEPGRTADDIREGMAVIVRNAATLAGLVDDMMDVSAIVSGKMNLHLESGDLAAAVRAAIEAVRPEAEAKSLKLRVRAQGPLRTEFDPKRMGQVLGNILTNAVKFTAPGGVIHVSLRRLEGVAEIAVQDTGEGIAPDFLPHVFDRYRRADESPRRRTPGIGLGLSIVKSLTELHGGRVTVESSGLGKGATFTVAVPLRAATVHEVPSPSVSTKLSLHGIHVLAVDDDPDARRLVTKVLADAGAEVTVAGNINDALNVLNEFASTDEPMVLVSDIAMPGGDGFDLIIKVRSQGFDSRQFPAVALTAFAGKGWARSALLGGFQVYVSKPIDPDELIATVASLVGRTGPQASTRPAA
ncbi:MAG TPA: ATP-binding protein [Terriglobales bacterium]|nr:ATP-binding protein [Terriglobales bacterium]